VNRFFWLSAIALVAVACGGANATATPGSQITQPPGATTGATAAITPVPNPGDNKSKAQALIPPGSSAPISEFTSGANYTVSVTSTMTVDQLGAFWTTAIPQTGMTESGRLNSQGTLIISLTNPDGGITATGTDQGVLVTISVGVGS
jgi:hypothetical protein